MSKTLSKCLTAVLTAVVLAAGVCITGYVSRDPNSGDWFKDKDLANWAWNKSPADEGGDESDISNDNEYSGVLVDVVEECGISMTSFLIEPEDYGVFGVSREAQSAYTLMATIEPIDATDKTVDWSISWENSSSSWASGKTVTDYVTVSPAPDGSATATIVCKQSFGEQVIVTVTSRFSENVKASATVDYSKKILASTVKVTANSKDTFLSVSDGTVLLNRSNYNPFVAEKFTAFDPIYSVYTADDNFNVTYSISLTSDFAELLYADLSNVFSTDVRTFATTKTQISEIYLYDVCFYIQDIYTLYGQYLMGGNSAFLYNVYIAECQTFAQQNKPVAVLTVTATGEHSTYSEDLYIGYQNSGFEIAVQSVILDKSNIVF